MTKIKIKLQTLINYLITLKQQIYFENILIYFYYKIIFISLAKYTGLGFFCTTLISSEKLARLNFNHKFKIKSIRYKS